MTATRLSQLQEHILRWWAADHQRTQGRITSSHPELVRALHRDKGNSSLASGLWQRGAGFSLGARLVGKPNPCGSPQRGRNGPPSLQEVVINRKIFSKQLVRVSAIVRVELVLPSLQEVLPKLLPNCEKGCGM
jgi:hypothetical protein